MNPICLNKIPINGLKIDETVDFDESYYKNTDIIELKNVKVTGFIKRNIEQDFLLSLKVNGSMKIPDARTLQVIDYPFTLEMEEKIDETNDEIQEYLEKKQNILDIMGILWENIVLEVPISKTTGNLEELKGDGWELVSEKIKTVDPRLSKLEKLFDSEKE